MIRYEVLRTDGDQVWLPLVQLAVWALSTPYNVPDLDQLNWKLSSVSGLSAVTTDYGAKVQTMYSRQYATSVKVVYALDDELRFLSHVPGIRNGVT